MAAFVLATNGVSAQSPEGASDRKPPISIGITDARAVLKLLGAKMEHGVTGPQLDTYRRQFELLDLDKDGKHSQGEFIEKGTYLTPQARRGIFNAADADADKFVTRAEYILNRIITDEAKSIVQAMDDDKDRVIQREEFLENAFEGKYEKLVKLVFAELDTDKDGEIRIPEYLRVWGKWARAGLESAEKRLSAREKSLRKESEKKRPAKSR